MLKKSLFAAMIALSFTILSAAENKFTFVQITDSHLGVPGNDVRTAAVIDGINKLPLEISFIVHTGDVYDFRADFKTLDDTLSVFKQSKYRVYYIPGNNEIDKKSFAEKYETFERKVSKINFAEVSHDVLLVFFYTSPYIKITKYDQLAEFQWLEKTLISAGDKPVLIFAHIPDADSFFSNKLHDSEWLKANSDYFAGLVNKYNVKAVITGHYHGDEMHYIGNVPLYVSPAIAKMEAGLSYYRIFEYNSGKLSYRTIMVK